MLSFPNCKINLGLNIINKRADGYHNLETVFLPVPLQDALEILPAHNSDKAVTFACTGLPVAGDEANNLCIKAYQLLKSDFPQLPPVNMHLHKAIPMGAGLGGGSADGAFTLLLLNNKFKLGLSEADLIRYALQLGSDCPFFIINQPCYAEGRGEKLERVSLDLKGYILVLVNPGVHISTGWAFSHITPKKPVKNIKTIISQPIETWRDELVNDFEAPVIATHPALQAIKDTLYAAGAVYAAMSGSGSTFYGLFADTPSFTANPFPSHYLMKQVLLA